MTVTLETAHRICWRCGGSGTINHNTDRCPGCAGTGQQPYQRPRAAFHACHDCPTPFTCTDVLQCLGVPDPDQEAGDFFRQSGPMPPRAGQTCPRCGGSGMIMVTVQTPDGRMETRTDTCTGCGGSGQVG